MFTAWTAAAATVAKSKFSPLYRRCLMQNASALKSFLHRVMRIFYCLPGAVTRAMRSPALRAWQSAPDPKICISYGACGNSGGIFHDLYCVWGGTDKIVPVDVYIPGCPPTPAATLYGFAMALGLLEQKIHARGPGELDEQPAEILHGDMVQPLRVKVDREARRLAGYRYGRQIADDYLTQLGQGEEQVARWLEAENDPRLNEIVSHLNHVVEEARIR